MRWQSALFVGLTFGVLGCSSPAGPTGTAANIVATGPQVLRITLQAACTQLGQGVLPMVYTRVTVTTASTEWVASATSAIAGDVQIRFHQLGASVVAGAVPIAGSMTGTAVHLPELFAGPAWDVRAKVNSSALVTGNAFAAGTFGSTTNGVDGVGDGALTLTDGAGNTCAGSTFSWSLFPLPS